MKIALPTRKLIVLLLAFLTTSSSLIAAYEPIPSGSFIINMGVVPQTYDNGIKPWGMLHDLIKNHRVLVKWVINPSKVKDGIDFSYSGTSFKGGTFIIPAKYRSAAVNARITYWQSQGVVGVTTTSALNVDVTYSLKYTPRWTFDYQNGNIALDFLEEAGIPNAEYAKKYPSELNSCDDLFVMPHADPTWGTHSNLLNWNQGNRGWIWAGCHAVSVLENLFNPADSTQQMNFLSQKGLVPYGDHEDGTPPYQYRFPNDAEMQFMGVADEAMQNGSEQIFLPKINTWRTSTKVAAYNSTHENVPSLSPGEAAAIVYGRAFGDSARGKVMYEGGHNINKGDADAVAAMRAFFNFSYLSVYDKAINPTIIGPINVNSLTSYTYRATLPVGSPSANYTYRWTSSCGGTFSKPFDTVTVFTAPLVNNCTGCTIYCTITDGCGREYYQEFDITICSVIPPVALNRITEIITNPDGTGPQSVGNAVPLAGTDEDGYLVNYILKSLPANGVLFYDNDNNAATADVAINSLPSGELVLTAQQMKTLSFDPADGYAGNANFLYTVADNSGLRDLTPATYTIPVNPPPVAITKICTPVGSNAGKSDACDMQATDNGSIVSYTITSLPAATQCTVYINNIDAYVGQVLTLVQATQITFKPTGTYVGYAEIMYTATDNNGAVDITPATLTLQMVNQPPSANDVSAVNIANPAGNVMYTLPALSATDTDGAVTSYTITAKPAETQGVLYYNNAGSSYAAVINNQPLTLAQSATLKFDPNDNFSGSASLQYTAKDNRGLVDNTPATLYIPVQLVPPVAKDTTNPSTYAGGGWQPIYGLAATNPGYTIVSYKVLTVPNAATVGKIGYGANILITAGMTLTPAQAASMKFDPKKGFTGVTGFTYTCTNDIGLTDLSPAIVTLPVHNNEPVANNILNAAIANTAGQTTIAAFTGSDIDEMPMSGHKFTITSLPAASFGILYLGTIPVFPGQLITASQALTLKFDPATNSRDTATFTYTLTDECGTADATPAVFKIPITAALSAPVSADVNMSPISIRQVANPIPALNGTDVDGTIVSFKIQTTTSPFDGTLYLDGMPLNNNDILPYEKRGQLYFIPSSTVTGTIFFKFRSIDNEGLQSTPANNYITIVNIAPAATNINMQAVRKNTTVMIAPLSATDSDGVIASYTILSLPTSAHVLQCDLLGNNVYSNVIIGQILNPAQSTRLRINFNSVLGTSTFTYSATDNSSGTSNVATYSIPVTSSAANQFPVAGNITNASIPMNSGVTSISPLLATDLDGSIASYTIINIPPYYYGKLLVYNSITLLYDTIAIGNKPLTTAQAATLKFLPSGLFAGDVTFTYTAKDNLNATSALATFTIPVTCPDPVATNLNNAAVSSNAGPALLQSLAATTAGSISGFYITDLPTATQGVLVMDGSPVTTLQFIPLLYAGRLEFDPEPFFVGTASFLYTAVDNLGSNDKTPATVTIPVTSSVPFALERISQVITNTIGTSAVFIPAMSGYDNDGTIVSYTIKTLPTNGTLYVNGVAATVNQVLTPAQAVLLSFDPADNFAGTTSFTFNVKDNSGINSATANYTIVSNLPPVAYDVLNPGMVAGQVLTSIQPLVATDNGSITSYSILTLPAATDGVLYLNNVPVTSLAQVNSLNSAQVNQLKFLPSSSFSGAIFSYSAYDNMGIIDVTPAVYTIPYFNQSTLPVNLLSFSGIKDKADDLLKWSTAQEVNAGRFELEHSTTAANYVKIGEVAAKGFSFERNDYTFTHKNVANGVHYYRLKMIDRDNQFKYSPVIALKRDGDNSPLSSVSPNPFNDKIMIVLQSESRIETLFTIYDMNGKIMLSKNVRLAIGINQVHIDRLDGLGKGAYMLHIKNSDVNISTKLLKLQ